MYEVILTSDLLDSIYANEEYFSSFDNLSHVEKGDIVFQPLHNDDINANVYSPVSGYIFYHYSDFIPSQMCGKVVAVIADTLDELIPALPKNEYHIVKDEFNKEITICWDKVFIGDITDNTYSYYQYFHFMLADEVGVGLNINHVPVIQLYFAKEYYVYNIKDIEELRTAAKVEYRQNLNIGDRFEMLFNDETCITYIVNKKPKKAPFLENLYYVEFEIKESDFKHMIEHDLIKARITPVDGGNQKVFDEIYELMFRIYAKDFIKILTKNNIDWYSEQMLEGTEENGNKSSCNSCYVYLMLDKNTGFYKIGISKDPKYRERTLQSEKPTIEMICSREYPSRPIAEAIESALHKTYNLKRVRGEWFDLSSSDVEDLRQVLK